ncbi:hypothetical protein IMY05_C4590000400 [Salix suchowensis]|nr:hypothetical protein IMY05_C4590000400 [Salix suchowensis]
MPKMVDLAIAKERRIITQGSSEPPEGRPNERHLSIDTSKDNAEGSDDNGYQDDLTGAAPTHLQVSHASAEEPLVVLPRMDITADPDDGLRLLSSDEQLAIEQGTSTLDTKSEDEGGNNLKKRYLSCKDKLIRQACKACGVKEDDIAEQLHHIKWPQIDASADLVTFDAALAVVTWLAKHTEFKMKKKDAKRKEPRHNNCPAFYHTEDNGNRTIRYLTQSECLSTMADPHKNPGVLEIPPEDAAQVFTTRVRTKNPLGYVNNFQLSDKVALNCGCSISSGLLELWLEKTAAAAGVPVRGDTDIVFTPFHGLPNAFRLLRLVYLSCADCNLRSYSHRRKTD